MTPETIGVGWFLIAAALLILGPFVMWLARREARDEATAQKAERIIVGPTYRPDVEADISQAVHLARAFDAIERGQVAADRMAAVAGRMKADPPRLSVVPEPRKTGELS